MGTLIDRDGVIDEVMWRGGVRDRSQAEAVIEALLDAVANHLGAADRAFIAERLPAPYAAAVQGPTAAAASRPSDLYARLATRAELSPGAAVEHTRAASSCLGDILGEEARSLLARRLPPDWAELFAPVESATEADLPGGTVPGHGRTLATGRFGSSHPLAEAEPPTAQSDSVATANPHGDSKISSAADLDPENDLASGRPGAQDPIAQARDERPRR